MSEVQYRGADAEQPAPADTPDAAGHPGGARHRATAGPLKRRPRLRALITACEEANARTADDLGDVRSAARPGPGWRTHSTRRSTEKAALCRAGR